jgi:hypothetical protein
MIVNQLPAFVVSFGSGRIQETVVSGGFGLRARATSEEAASVYGDSEQETGYGLRPCGFNGLTLGFVGSYDVGEGDDHNDFICSKCQF